MLKLPPELYLYGELWTYSTPCSSVSIVNFEHLIAGWVLATDSEWNKQNEDKELVGNDWKKLFW